MDLFSWLWWEYFSVFTSCSFSIMLCLLNRYSLSFSSFLMHFNCYLDSFHVGSSKAIKNSNENKNEVDIKILRLNDLYFPLTFLFYKRIKEKKKIEGKMMKNNYLSWFFIFCRWFSFQRKVTSIGYKFLPHSTILPWGFEIQTH